MTKDEVIKKFEDEIFGAMMATRKEKFLDYYGGDAEDVMRGRAHSMAKEKYKKLEEKQTKMDKKKIREMIKDALSIPVSEEKTPKYDDAPELTGKQGKNLPDALQKAIIKKKGGKVSEGKVDKNLIKEFIGGNTEKRISVLFDKLVPSSGNADTVEGEIIRALNRIIYRWGNDGDHFSIGYGAETAGPAMEFLTDAPGIPSEIRAKFKAWENDNFGREYEKEELIDLAMIALPYVEMKVKEDDLTPNKDDLFNYGDKYIEYVRDMEREAEEDEYEYGGYYDDLDEDDYLQENVNPEVHRLVNAFVKKMADRYDYSLQDAVYAMLAVLRSQNYLGLNEKSIKESLRAWNVIDAEGNIVHKELPYDKALAKAKEVEGHKIDATDRLAEGDLDLGHEDYEPKMLQGDLYRIGKYAMGIYKMLEPFDTPEMEVDLPHWWQSKIIKAKDYLVSAKHYLDFELKEPAIDAMVTKDNLEEIGMFSDPIGYTKPKPSPIDQMFTKKYVSPGVYDIFKNGEKIKTIDGGEGKANAYINQLKRDLKENQPTVLDDDSMDALLNIILKYVKDPADAEKELERFDAGGFDSLSNELQANLDRDKEYKAWYNELHGIKEDATPLKKDYCADYTDIGMFYVEGSEEEKSLTDNEFEELGEKIVKQLYAGDVGKAYDDIVRGETRGSVNDLTEKKQIKENMNYDKWRRAFNGKSFASKVVLTEDPMGNKKRYIIFFRYSETPRADIVSLSEQHIGGHEGSGMPFAISNMQNKPKKLFTPDDEFSFGDDAEFEKFLQEGSKGLENMLSFFSGGQNVDNAIRKWFDTGVQSVVEIKPAKYFNSAAVNERKLTKAELKKREEIAKAIEKDQPKIDMSKKMAIATDIAKRVAEGLPKGYFKKMGVGGKKMNESFDKFVDKLQDQGYSEKVAKKIAGAVNAAYVKKYK